MNRLIPKSYQVKNYAIFLTKRFASTYINFGYRTLFKNQKAIIKKLDGTIKYVDGPCRNLIFRSEYEELYYKKATDNQFIAIDYVDGKREHIKGPNSRYFDPIHMSSMEVCDADIIRTGEAAVFRNKDKEIAGPAFVFPEIDEIDNIKKVNYVTANENEYLELVLDNGEIKHINGPANIANNPYKYRSVIVKKKINVDGVSSIYVYTKNIENGTTYVGPLMYFPQPHETIITLIKTYIVSSDEYIIIKKEDGTEHIIQGPIKYVPDYIKDLNIQVKRIINVEVNKALIITDKVTFNGTNAKIIEGPCKYTPKPNDNIELVNIVSAEVDEYISVVMMDGVKNNLSGPARVIMDPYIYKSVIKNKKLMLNENEVIIVYSEQDKKISRKKIEGPISYIPAVNEWVHQFSWHGAPKDEPYVKKRDVLVFNKLRTNPTQMFYNIEFARTKDDARISIKIAIFFELIDIDKMLDNTNDVIAEFMNGSNSDLTDFLSKHTYEEFKNNLHMLNEVSSYKRLVERANVIGYKINNVVFRGFVASDEIQKMYDAALKEKISLQLKQLTEEQKELLETLKLKAEINRSEEKHKLDKQQVINNNELEDMKKNSLLENRKKEGDFELRNLREKNDEMIRYYAKLSSLGTNLTEYLKASSQGKPDKLIMIENGKDNFHLHEHSGDEQLNKNM